MLGCLTESLPGSSVAMSRLADGEGTNMVRH